MKLPFSERGGGVRPLQAKLPILALGIHQGRLWALHLEVPSEANSLIPRRCLTAAGRVGVALSVLRWAVLQALEESTSDLRTRWRRIHKRLPSRRHQ